MSFGTITLPLTGSGDSTKAPAVDTIAGAEYQRVKLVAGVEGSTAVVGHVEDTAHTTGDGGIMLLAVRKDTATALAGTDGDYIPLIVDANGLLHTIIGAALPAGTNAIGKLAANSGVDIGDVDVTSVTPGTGASNLGKAEDAAHTTGDVGVMALAVRSDAGGAIAGTDGDYTPLQVNSSGELRVTGGGGGTQYTEGDTDASITGTAMMMEGAGNALVAAQGTASDGLLVNLGSNNDVTLGAALPAGTNAIGKLAANSGVDIGDVDVTSVIPGTGASNLGKAEDAAHSSGDVGVMALAVRSDAGGAIAGTDGDYTPLQVNSSGELRVTGGGGGTQYTEGDTDASITGTAMMMEGAGNALVAAQGTASDGLLVNLGTNNDVTLGAALPAGTNNIGDVDVLSVPAPLSTTGGGTEATALRVTVASDSTGVLSVDDNGGSLTVDGTVTANAGTGTRNVAGDVAHDSADSGGGGPVKIGGKARTTNPTAVADADRVDATFDDLGRQVVVLNQVRDLTGHQTTTITNSTAETTIVTAVASTFLDLVSLDITNASATAVTVTIKDATAGTTRAIYALAANGGVAKTWSVPLTQASTNNNWTATLSVNTVTVYINAQFVKNV